MADVTLTLGDVTFTDLEVPERLPFGTEQQLVVHRLVGGSRQVDAMGQDYDPIEWSGWILGPHAVPRAQSLDAMAASGLPVTLTWSSFSYQVIVRSFRGQFERFYQIPYRITLEVIQNNIQPGAVSTPSVDDAIAADNATADTLVASLNNTTLTPLMATVDALIIAAGVISAGPKSLITNIQQAVQAVIAQTISMSGSLTADIGTPTTFGGVDAGISAQASANALQTALGNTVNLVATMQLQGVLGRLMSNLGQVNSSPNVINLAGGNLFALAQQQYGDPTDWTALALANGLTDPFVQGVGSLTVPPQPASNGGILNS